jgi:Na+/H+-dicarboxylate symporter
VDINSKFYPLWRLSFIKGWWSADKGCLVGLVLGCIMAFNNNKLLRQIISIGKKYIEFLLTKIFSRLIPFFILGFAAQMYQTNLLSHIITDYTEIVGWLLLIVLVYIVWIFAIGAGWNFWNTLKHIKNLLPAGAIALTSGCSLSTMPWTISGTSKNLKNPQLANAVIPAPTNIQQIGDCIANTFLCFLIYRYFYGQNPDIMTWVNFSVVFVLARFATTAILGGAIFLMLPIYETYLGFDTEMISIILALNVVLDPIITSCNVLANGALCCIFEKVFYKLENVIWKQPEVM